MIAEESRRFGNDAGYVHSHAAANWKWNVKGDRAAGEVTDDAGGLPRPASAEPPRPRSGRAG
jgi:hypothetical protein